MWGGKAPWLTLWIRCFGYEFKDIKEGGGNLCLCPHTPRAEWSCLSVWERQAASWWPLWACPGSQWGPALWSTATYHRHQAVVETIIKEGTSTISPYRSNRQIICMRCLYHITASNPNLWLSPCVLKVAPIRQKHIAPPKNRVQDVGPAPARPQPQPCIHTFNTDQYIPLDITSSTTDMLSTSCIYNRSGATSVFVWLSQMITYLISSCSVWCHNRSYLIWYHYINDIKGHLLGELGRCCLTTIGYGES